MRVSNRGLLCIHVSVSPPVEHREHRLWDSLEGQMEPPQVIRAGRATGTASCWLPATAPPLPNASSSSPSEACRRQASGFLGGLAMPGSPITRLAKVSPGQEGATRAVPQDAA